VEQPLATSEPASEAASGAAATFAEDEEALFAQAVEAAREAKAVAAASAQPMGAWVEVAETISLSPSAAPEPAAPNVDEWNRQAREEAETRALAEENAQETAERVAREWAQEAEVTPTAWWQRAFAAAGNVKEAMDEALAESNAKALEEAKATAPLKPFKSRDLKALYKQLNDAIEGEDYDGAATLKARIDALKM